MNGWFPRLLQPLLLGLTLYSCGVGFDSIAELEGVRVLAVQKSKPYAKPGEQVELRMLLHDDAEESREVQVAWLSGCHNPPGDLYELCLVQLQSVLAGLDLGSGESDETSQLDALIELQAAGIGFGLGETFTVGVPDDIISSRPPPKDPKLPRYGLEYVFFAACAGELALDESGDFPLTCLDERGRQVGTDRFVVGYTAVYVYESLTNRNPRVVSLEYRPKALNGEFGCGTRRCSAPDGWVSVDEQARCLGAECSRPAPDAECTGREPRVSVCDDEDGVDCDTVEFRAVVDPKLVDVDGVLTRTGGTPVEEQMWLNYHADHGKFTNDLRLVNDVAAGFQTETGSEFIAPTTTGLSRVWAVVRDNRGGVDWARFDVCVE